MNLRPFQVDEGVGVSFTGSLEVLPGRMANSNSSIQAHAENPET